MKTIIAAAAAMLCLCGTHAHAASLQPGFYNVVVLYSSVTDPSGKCGSALNIVQGQAYDAEAVVGGAGKTVILNSTGAPTGSSAIQIATLTFSKFPANITSDPTNYTGSATGSQHDTGVTLSWNTGTINTIGFDEFKVTLSNVTVSYGGQAVCVANIDSGFVLTGK